MNPPARRIFISYRRLGAAHLAGRLHDRLGQHYGRANVFMDVMSVRPGQDFREVIRHELENCDVLIAVVDRTWSTGRSRRRLTNSDDLVRLEVVSALRLGLPVIPVLADGAEFPRHRHDPLIAELERRNAHRIEHERFESDVGSLLAALDEDPPPGRVVEFDGPVRRWAPRFLVGGAILALAAVLAVSIWLNSGGGSPGVQPGPTLATGCPPSGHGKAVVAEVVPLAGAGIPVTLGPASYVLGGGATVTLEIGGELRGTVPDDRELVFMLWSDPASTTSFGDPGTGRYYRSESFRVTNSCFYHESGEVGNDGDGGLVYRQYVFLVPKAELDALRSPEFDRTYTAEQLGQFNAEPIGYIEVPTS